MALLSTSSRLIKVGQDYSAGSGISIDNHTISVTGEFGKTYSAGDNIDIYEQDEQLYISSKDWTSDIANASANAYNEATAQIPDPFDPTYLSGEIDNKLNSTAFTTWQNGQYSTDLQTIEGQISNKLDTSSFSDVSGSFLTAHQSLAGYATEQWVEDKGYLTEVSIPESASWNETTTVVQSNSAQWAEGGSGDTEVNAYVYNNSASIDSTTSLVQSNSSTWNDITAYQSNSASFATTGNIGSNQYGQITGYNNSAIFATAAKQAQSDVFSRPITSTYYTTANANTLSSMLSGAIDYVSANAGGAGDEEVNTLVHSNSGEWNNVTAKQDSLTFGFGTTSGSVSSINGSAIIDDYTYHLLNVTRVATANLNKAITANSATWNTVTDKLDTTAQVITGYTTATIEGTNSINSLNGKPLISFRAASAQEAGVSNRARYDDDGNNLADDHNSLTALNGFVQSNSGTIDETVTAYQNNSATYLTAHQSLEGYATTGDLALKQDTLTFGYDEQDRINSINSSALAGGGDVPTGTMNVSGLEYNAVGEISGYGNSAIAQYGAEKQWLVHDDTLVHLSNSAQYALGCNISALQRLMGIDETVLFVNDSLDVNNGYKQTINLSEPYSAFKQLKIYYGDIYGNYSTYFDRIFNTEYASLNGVSARLYLEAPFGYADGSSILRRTTTYRFNSFTSMTAEVNASYNLKSPITASTFNYGDGSTANANKAVKVFKIIGIGRKQ